MCGRAAQTQHAVYAAANSLGFENCRCAPAAAAQSDASAEKNDNVSTTPAATGTSKTTGAATTETEQESSFTSSPPTEKTTTTTTTPTEYEWKDNYNLSPGMDAMVFYAVEDNEATSQNNSNNNNTKSQQQQPRKMIRMDRKIWGLVPKGGTTASPLPTGMNIHFQNLMFNARSDTLYQKATFSRLVNTGKTCLIALDGFFEWKQESIVGNSKAKKKQPYFVYRKKPTNNGSKVDAKSTTGATATTLDQEPPSPRAYRPFLLMTGLWTRVPTGRTDDTDNNKMLDTFTIITTEACPCLEWLHTRMPVFVWDDDLARQWLLNPSQHVYQQLVKQAKATTTTSSSSSTTATATTTPQQQSAFDSDDDRFLDWHAVTTEMSKTKYRSADSIKPLPKPKTVKSFFATAAAAAAAAADEASNNNKTKNDSTDDVKNNKQLQNKNVASSTVTKPATTVATSAASPPRKRPAATAAVATASKQQASGKKSKTTASTKNSSTPKKGSIQFFFSPKPKTEKKYRSNREKK